MNCPSCDALYINGVLCHESGCPDAWKDEVRECEWCGCDFTPEEKQQKCCSTSCERAYQGLPDDEVRYCLWCGGEIPEDRNGNFCSSDCDQSAYSYQERYEAFDR